MLYTFTLQLKALFLLIVGQNKSVRKKSALLPSSTVHERAEWIAPGNLMEHFDSHLRIKVMAL